MPKKTETSFVAKCAILADIWSGHRDDPDFEEFISYNDLGLPLAYLVSNGTVKATTAEAKELIEESFTLLLGHFEIDDEGFTSLTEFIAAL